MSESKEITCYGTHGTTVQNAKAIQFHGFCVSQKGQKGPGVYLWWSGSPNSHGAKHLACEWASRKQTPKNCVSIMCEVRVNDYEYLDFTDPDMIPILSGTIDKICRNHPDFTQQNVIKSLIDRFEKKTMKQIVVACHTVTPPQKRTDIGKWLLGNPKCYTVYDPNRISILRIDMCSE